MKKPLIIALLAFIAVVMGLKSFHLAKLGIHDIKVAFAIKGLRMLPCFHRFCHLEVTPHILNTFFGRHRMSTHFFYFPHLALRRFLVELV